MKTAIQLTILRICNTGSVLQAYALRRAIESVSGWKCVAIDIAPDLSGRRQGDASGVENGARRGIVGLLQWIDHKRRVLAHNGLMSVLDKIREGYDRRVFRPRVGATFEAFLRDEVGLTRRYESKKDLQKEVPEGDLYITGSDQTFNPRYTNADDLWFFSFLKEKPRSSFRKISYAASFGSSVLSARYRDAYADALQDYDALSLREQQGVDVAASLGLKAEHCCDPTLLLPRESWAAFAEKSTAKIPDRYILCYTLDYITDPWPLNRKIEKRLKKTLGLPIVYLQPGYMCMSGPLRWHRTVITVYDFVRLFFKASFILTSSFHGTVFSLLSGNPFLSYVQDTGKIDGRVMDLLRKCEAVAHAVVISPSYELPEDLSCFASTSGEKMAVERFREKSHKWLRVQLESK